MRVVIFSNSLPLMIKGSGLKSSLEQHGVRWMVTKASNRSAVHGSHLPAQDSLVGKSAIEEEIEKGKQRNEEKRKTVEAAVDSKTSNLGKDIEHR